MRGWKFLSEELQANDKKAFEYIYQTFYPRLCAFANQYAHNQAIAEDVVGDVMYELWRKKREFENLESIKAFLFVSVKNKVLTYLRKQNISVKHAEEIKNLSSNSFFTETIIEEELIGLLNEALNQLPEKARRVFKLTCIDGLKYKEVAEDLNISVNTVKSQRARAIELLRKLLKDKVIWVFILGLLK